MIDVPILVKDALRDGTLKKNYRFNVLNNDGTVDFTIDNDTLVKESVSIDERMASGDTIKFGLCEGSSLEFQYFWIDKGEYDSTISYMHNEVVHYDNQLWICKMDEIMDISPGENADLYWAKLKNKSITNRRIQAFIDVQYEDDGAILEHEIPMGFFDVKESSRQASTGIIKVVAYNKLMSDYLDAKANAIILDTFTSKNTEVFVYDIQNILLDDFQIKHSVASIEPSEDTAGWLGWSYPMNELPLYFTQIYGLETPFSAWEYWNKVGTIPTSSTKIYAYLASGTVDYQIDGADAYSEIRENFGDISIFEYNIRERIKYIFDSAKLRTTVTTPPMTGGIVTGDMMVDYLCKNAGFQNIFGISVSQNNVTKVYSTIQWEYEEANNIAHTVNGTVNDFIKASHKGSMHITISIPYKLDGLINQFTSGSEPLFVDTYYGMRETYRYWLYEYDYASSGVVWLYPIQYANGTEYNNQASTILNFADAITVGTIELNKADAIRVNIGELPDYTLREIVSASYETQCQFGQLDRITDLFSGHELNSARLLPQETLYPDDSLYPYGGNLSVFKSMYSKLWADEGNVQSWRYLIITYKGLDESGNEKEYKLQRTVNEHGTQNYNCSDNWLFKNLIWTSEQIGQYADAMVEKMRDMRWFPFEMWCAGLPYVETGDEIEIAVGEETYTTYVLQRQLKGIQNLQDTYINGTLDIF